MDRSELRSRLLEMLKNETWEEYDSIEDDMHLRDTLNLDSVDLISLVLTVQNDFNINIESDELESIETVGNLLDLLEAKLGDSSSQAA